MSGATPATHVDSIVPLLSKPQFYWFVGHFIGLFSFIVATVKSLFSTSIFWYRLSLLAQIFTYGLVLRQTHLRSFRAISQPGFALKILRDENLHYLSLAAVFYLSAGIIGPVQGGLYSFAIFSTFHFLSYFQNNILTLLPLALTQQQRISTAISRFTSSFSEPALVAAGIAELLLLTGFFFSIPRTVISIFKRPLYTIVNVFVFATVVVFLRLRYETNKYLKYAVSMYDQRVTAFFNGPMGQLLPPALKERYFALRTAVVQNLEKIKLPKKAAEKKQ